MTFLSDAMSGSIVNARGADWKSHRIVLSPSFTGSKLKQVPSFLFCMDNNIFEVAFICQSWKRVFNAVTYSDECDREEQSRRAAWQSGPGSGHRRLFRYLRVKFWKLWVFERCELVLRGVSSRGSFQVCKCKCGSKYGKFPDPNWSALVSFSHVFFFGLR